MIHAIEKRADPISRRDFFKVLGVGLAAAGALSGGWVLAEQLPVQIDFGERQVRGTAGGQISHSLDQGQTWQVLVNFGPQCSVTSLRALNGQIFARLVTAGYPFWLSSTDARTWRTIS